jgi:hypothetical protein
LVILLVVVVVALGAGWYAHSIASTNKSNSSVAKSKRRPTTSEHSRPTSQRRKSAGIKYPKSVSLPEKEESVEDTSESEAVVNPAVLDSERRERPEPRRPLIIVGSTDVDSKEETTNDERTRTTTEEGDAARLTLYQDIDVQKEPTISVEGIPMKQALHYRIISRLIIEPQAREGKQNVRQEVLETGLEAADDTSREEYEKSLSALKGLVLTFQVGHDGYITNFKGHKESRATTKIERSGSAGFLVTSLIDEDGWKELNRLTFFRPKSQRSGDGSSWTDQMTHDWGPLGKWTGLTTFTPKGDTNETLQQYEYVHEMKYEPPSSDAAGLPFQLKDAEFQPVQAGGLIHYDSRRRQVSDVQERFHVRGTIHSEVLGQSATIEIEELQTLTIRLTDQMPQMSR